MNRFLSGVQGEEKNRSPNGTSPIAHLGPIHWLKGAEDKI